MARLQIAVALSTLGAGLAGSNIYRLATDGHGHRTVTYVLSYVVAFALVSAVVVLTWALARKRSAGEEPPDSGDAAFDTSRGGETTVEGGSVKGYKRVSRVAGGVARFINVKIRRR